ncbi:hypothetical protein PROFUN_11071 [Planoprotostelium fungivorum]|uniref:N-acetyltransferase domain-containing protein n=1 Tax=Planoprotostelium fungivorum TaxID=1890364 RepID=A0A2P6NBN9_9EUKA|nr:hypothetical protein PROFUN_11071 [Planoprotostelium fungivorum]
MSDYSEGMSILYIIFPITQKATQTSLTDPGSTPSFNPHAALEEATEDITSEVECISRSFSKSNDPFTRALKLTPTQWGVMSQMFVQRAAHQDMSLIAYDPDVDEVKGVIINEDWKETPPSDYHQLMDWRPVRAMFNDLHIRFKATQPRIEAGRLFHPLYFTCVRPETRNSGIATELWLRSLDIARERNYTDIVCEASAASSVSLCKKLGFREVAGIDYQNFMFDGKFVFADLDKKEFDKMTLFQRPITSDLFI